LRGRGRFAERILYERPAAFRVDREQRPLGLLVPDEYPVSHERCGLIPESDVDVQSIESVESVEYANRMFGSER
jgi:hypothetical protein